MRLRPIIDDIADQADDFLAGITTRAEARDAISAKLTAKHPVLSGIDRIKVIDGVLAILDQEEFFGSGSSPNQDGSSDGVDGP